MSARADLSSWKNLQQHAKQIKNNHLRDLFANDSKRFDKFSVNSENLLFDYSKNLIDEDVINNLLRLAKDVDLEKKRDEMFAGEKINITEQRAVLHTALRSYQSPIIVDGVDICQDVKTELAKMQAFVEKVRGGKWRGYSNKAITDVVSIGVGGSNLGPQMITEALKAYSDHTLKVHYVSNVDGAQIVDVLSGLNPETVLFVVSSKTFTTSETMTNANTATKWLLDSAKDSAAIAKHFVAVSTNISKVTEFGINPENIFTMWDWVGGRFSLWSAIGLPIALNLGFEVFEQLLAGASKVDKHFVDTPLENNIPVLMALLSVWNCTFLNYNSQAILPYEQTLHRLPAYLQQAEMESNGKHVTMQGDVIDYRSVPLIWGEIGINGQHAFYQYLHQGNNIVPADFIGAANSDSPVGDHHNVLMSNFFAQSQALMNGVSAEEITADLKAEGVSDHEIARLTLHKVHQGNRPSNTFLFDKITANTVGQLIALYEHKIFCQGILLDICSFDQWGVELGKGLAANIEKELKQQQVSASHDSSTANLMSKFFAMQK